MNFIFKKIFNHRSETILGAGLITASFALLSSVLGIVRNALLASHFGANAALDIYYATFRLPDLIYNIFIFGTISPAFIPLLSDYLTKEREKAWQFSSLVITLVSFFLIISGTLIIVFAYPLLKKILIGFSEENIKTTVFLTRIIMIQPLLLGISAVFSSILRSFKLFLVSALSPVVYNAGIILGILFLSPIFGLKGLIYGVILGAFLHLIIQIPSLWSIGYHFEKFKISLFVFSLKKMFAIMFSRALSIILSQIFLLGVTSIATLLKEGTITIFNFVDNILPYTIFALPLADAAFPYLSRLESEGKKEEFIFQYLKTLTLILLFIIPLALWIIVFKEPIVRFLLGYGKFDWKATVTTMQVLSVLALAMIFQSLNYYFLKVFFAKKDAKNPFLASLVAYLSGLVMCYYFGINYGPKGLAGGVFFTYLFYFLLLVIFLKKHFSLPLANKKDFVISFGKISFASILSSLVGYCLLNFFKNIYSFTKVKNLFFGFTLSLVLTVIVFLAISQLLKIEELTEVFGYLKKRFLKKENNALS